MRIISLVQFLARIGTPVYFNRITKQINSDAFSDTLCSYSSLRVCGRKLNKVLMVV